MLIQFTIQAVLLSFLSFVIFLPLHVIALMLSFGQNSASFLAAAIICAEEALFSLAFPPFCKLSYLSTSALTVGLTTHLFV